ncbi:MAG: universal stress protein, partial [Acidobacteriaceae bacterium]|nr:universal stress protein [Acidobacteriaceae bacterium]
ASDRQALANALSLAKSHKAQIVLLHVEEGITSQLFGSQASTAEIQEGEDYLEHVASSLREQGVAVEIVVRHGNKPASDIARVVRTSGVDLVVMASHGHRGIKDLIFGTTINSVRHDVKVPLLIVSGS